MGYFAVRMPGSMGTFDVLASRVNEDTWETFLRFIEVKSTQAGPYAGFGPADRAALLAEAELAGAEASLCWWPKNKEPQFIRSENWP
jgi:hypothetical protein